MEQARVNSYSYNQVNIQDTDENTTCFDDEQSNTHIDTEKPVRQIISDVLGILLLVTYVTSGVAIVSFMIAAYMQKEKVFTDTMMALILGCALLTTVLSAIALVNYGRLQDQVERLKQENREYGTEIDYLKTSKVTLTKEIGDFETANDTLNNFSMELKEEAKEFDDLLGELKGIAKDGEEVLSVVDNLNATFQRMNDWIYRNEKAYLLCAYYDAAYSDDDNNMDKGEYNRFLNAISKRFRERFRRLGKFEKLCDKGKDSLDLQRFLEKADIVLRESQDIMQEEFMKNYNLLKM